MATSNKLHLLTGGIGLGMRQLSKYSKLYANKPTYVQPFTLAAVASPRAMYPDYHKVYKESQNYDEIHLHTLSGSCHFVVNLVEQYPDLKAKISSAVFDSPCHIQGIPAALKHLKGVPEGITRPLISTVFRGAITTSDTFVREALLPGVPTGVIYSDRDKVAPVTMIEQMLESWAEGDAPASVLRMKTNSEHLLTMRDQVSGDHAGQHRPTGPIFNVCLMRSRSNCRTRSPRRI